MSRNIIFVVIAFIALMVISYFLCSPNQNVEQSTAGDIVELYIEQNGGQVTIKEDKIQALIDGTRYEAALPSDFDPQVFLPAELAEEGALTIAYTEEAEEGSSWQAIILNLLPLVLFVILLFFIIRRFQRGFGQQQPPPQGGPPVESGGQE